MSFQSPRPFSEARVHVSHLSAPAQRGGEELTALQL